MLVVEEVRENGRADRDNNPGFGVWRVRGRGRGDDAGRYRSRGGDVSFGGGSGGGLELFLKNTRGFAA